jgi:hypothetical protein
MWRINELSSVDRRAGFQHVASELSFMTLGHEVPTSKFMMLYVFAVYGLLTNENKNTISMELTS